MLTPTEKQALERMLINQILIMRALSLVEGARFHSGPLKDAADKSEFLSFCLGKDNR